ncbi:conserved phage C-terminal domain-containing protein [Bacillus anthracis]|uniref:conserved phage C-terminal domain-containing protein n=1 Tax=Bacillus anthracis TaxID=1392 RepID=UPI000BF492F7|nr:conserved phage C-terminal domain-containing protein [Bacillus anthracis]PGB54290.1 chromosomal replication initiator DnaA [Bacillus anthracis]
MAKYRHVQTTFWSDPKVTEEMTPEDRYFYLYLMTNEHTTQIGVYQITRKQMAFELGYSIESAKALLDRFTKHHELIVYNEETREICILNWGKYNLIKGGKPIEDCIQKELKTIKDLSLVKLVLDRTKNDVLVKKISIMAGFDDTYHDTSTIRGQKEKEKDTTTSSSDESDIQVPIPYQEILEYLNEKAGKNFNYKAEAHRKLIRARWNEGYTVENFKTVINNKASQWLGKFDRDNKPLDRYLRPSTLFAQKHFDNYLNETVSKPQSNQQQYGNRIDIPGFKGNMPF